jgi:hypothetical protein
MHGFRSVPWLPALLALLGCASDVTGPSAASGGVGGGATSGATSAMSSGSGGGTSSASSTSTGTSGICGGKAGGTCGEGEYCDFADGSCGGFDNTGVCLVSPAKCGDDCPGVCACGGKVFCNGCEAAQAGLDVSAAACPGEGTYSAYLWLGGLDHLVIAKADPVAGICVRLYLDAPMDNQPGFDLTAPASWGVSHAGLSYDLADCEMQAPGAEAEPATGGTGSLEWDVAIGMYYPCNLTIDASIAFPSQSVAMVAVDVPVEGGCL